VFDVFSFDLTGSPLQKPRRYFSESSTITSNERLVCKPYNGVVRPWATRSQKFSVVEKLSHGCRRLEKSMISYSIVTDRLGAMYALDAMYIDKGRIGLYTKLCDFTLLFMILQVELRLNKDH